MKKSILALSLLAALQTQAQCYRSLNASLSMGVGVDKNGFTEIFEAGVWGVDQPLGGSIGFIFRNHIVNGVERGKPIQYSEPFSDIHLRATYKAYQDEHFYTVVTAYGSIKGDLCASVRIYKPLGDHVVAGIEPSLSYKSGVGMSTVFTFNF